MSEKIRTASHKFRQAHSLLTLIAHSELSGFTGPDGLPVIDGGVIQMGLQKVCDMIDEADGLLDDFLLEDARNARQVGEE